ncbi:MAG: WG repeat-containing protein [Clostridiales bacterium]|jgi:hypothetical protein|nr:WG repeat-containing protein [Clostridiales bacterium]
MNKASRILLGIGFLALLLVSWIVAANSKSSKQKQSELLTEANELISDEIYIRALPLLEEAAGYKAAYTLEAETRLKDVYIELMGQSGIKNKYINLLEKQMGRDGVASDIYIEAANFYLDTNKLQEALTVLKSGISKLGDQTLVDFYEANRYAFKINRSTYDDVSSIANGLIQVSNDGLWGLANSDGTLIISCEYDKLSSYSNSRSIALKGGIVYAVDLRNNRLFLLYDTATDLKNYGDDRIGVLLKDGWHRANGELVVGSMAFEDIGMYSGGFVAAKQNGKWGVVDIGSEWLVPAEWEGIIQDDLGRCYAQGAVFAINNGKAVLIVNGTDTGKEFEDARPFVDGGWAAVKEGGKWGFIDTTGTFQIAPQFDDALSFSGHLAAVKQGDLWGYLSLTGKMAIEPQFKLAKSFLDGNAPVLTDNGYQFISLTEYKKDEGF